MTPKAEYQALRALARDNGLRYVARAYAGHRMLSAMLLSYEPFNDELATRAQLSVEHAPLYQWGWTADARMAHKAHWAEYMDVVRGRRAARHMAARSLHDTWATY